MSRLALGLLVALSAVATGCTSVRTTIMQRLEDDSFVHNPQKKVKGIPVKLKVPSHLRVKIVERYYITKDTNHGNQPVIQTLCKPQLDVATELVYTDKVFTVDFKRPAAGILDLKGAALDDEFYFSQVQAKVEDETLKDINAGLNKVKGPLFGAKTGNLLSGDDLVEQERVVAFQQFDINELGWEEQVQAFIDSHLTACATPCACPVSK